MLLVLRRELLFDTSVHIVELGHQAGPFITIFTSFLDFHRETLTLVDVRLVVVVNGSIGELLNLSVDCLVVLDGQFHVFALKLALDALMLHTEVVLITTLLLHVFHKFDIVVDIVPEFTLVTMLVLIDRAEVLLDLISVFLILRRLLLSFSFNRVELLSLLELGLVLSTGTSGFQLGLQFGILLVLLFLELLLDVLLSILELLEHILEVAIAASILQLFLEH